MALWGKKDSVPSAGTITINLSTKVVTGSSTLFNTNGYVVTPGDIITVGVGATYGQAVIASVTSNTVVSVAKTQFLIPDPATGLIPAGTAYSITEKPKYTLEDHQYYAPDVKSNKFSAVFGVDNEEQQVANTSGSKYKPAHAGWVGVTTYTDMHGNLRVKTETLVAMGRDSAGNGGITGDAADDARYPDS